MSECENLYQGALKYKEEYDEFSVVDEEMRLISLLTISIARPLYMDQPEELKWLDEAAKILLTCLPA